MEDAHSLFVFSIFFVTQTGSETMRNMLSFSIARSWNRQYLEVMSDKAVRRPDLIKPWRLPPPTAPDDLPPDYMALLSLMFGLVGLLGKVPPRRAWRRELPKVPGTLCALAGPCTWRRAGSEALAPIHTCVCAQMKLGSWLAIFACISSLANVKKSMVDYKQMLCSVT